MFPQAGEAPLDSGLHEAPDELELLNILFAQVFDRLLPKIVLGES